MRQAEEVLGPLKTAILRKRGPVFKVLTIGSKYNTTGDPETRQKLASTKKGIENRLNGSTLEVYPMSIDKLQGLRSSVNTIDEWLSCDIREDVVAAVEQGSSKNNDYEYTDDHQRSKHLHASRDREIREVPNGYRQT